MEDRVSDGISSSRVGCEEGSELPDETDLPEAGHDDMADYIKTGNNNTAIEEEMNGDLQSQVKMTTSITITHTQQPTEPPPASNSLNKPYHKTKQKDDTSRKTARPKEAQTATTAAIRQSS